jgi:hypothetical protein
LVSAANRGAIAEIIAAPPNPTVAPDISRHALTSGPTIKLLFGPRGTNLPRYWNTNVSAKRIAVLVINKVLIFFSVVKFSLFIKHPSSDIYYV